MWVQVPAMLLAKMLLAISYAHMPTSTVLHKVLLSKAQSKLAHDELFVYWA